MPTISSENERINGVLKRIVNYLLAKEIECLAMQGKTKVMIDRWSEGFDPNNF
jgi:hypothetical protein